MRRYTNVALPDELIERIDNIIQNDCMGYKSRGEFVKEAVRKLLISLVKLRKYSKRKE